MKIKYEGLIALVILFGIAISPAILPLPQASLFGAAVPYDTGTKGRIIIQPNSVNGQAYLDASTTSTGATNVYYFPNSTGTVCLTSTCLSASSSTNPFMATYFVATSTSKTSSFPNASSTNFSIATFLTIPNSSSQAPTIAGQLALDTTNDQLAIGDGSVTSVFDKRRSVTLTYSTTTTWTGSTTIPTFVIPFGYTWNTITCLTQPAGSTLNAQYQYANSAAYASVFPTMIPASSTPGIYTFSSNNTPTAQATSTITFGTPASTPTAVACTLTGVATGT